MLRTEVALRGEFKKDLPPDTRAVNILVVSKARHSKAVVVDLTLDCPAEVSYEDCVERFKELNPGYSVSIWTPFNKADREQPDPDDEADDWSAFFEEAERGR